MSRRFYSKRELAFIARYCAKKPPIWIAERLDRHVTSIREQIRKMGRRSGVPKGYVGIRESLGIEKETTLNNTTDWYTRKARNEGVLYHAGWHRAPYCVPEWWMSNVIEEKLERATNDEIARREGWLTSRDIAEAMGRSHDGVRMAIRAGRSPFGRDMQKVMRIQGVRMTWYYEPQGTRLAIARHTGMRRAA